MSNAQTSDQSDIPFISCSTLQQFCNAITFLPEVMDLNQHPRCLSRGNQ
jgi:hypothetical protein